MYNLKTSLKYIINTNVLQKNPFELHTCKHLLSCRSLQKMHNKHMFPIETDNYYLIRRHAHKLNWKHVYQINSSMHNIKTQVTLTPQMDQWTNIIAYHHVVLVKLNCVRNRFNIMICFVLLNSWDGNIAFLLKVNRVLPAWDNRSTRYKIWSSPGISPSSPNTSETL